MKALSLIGIVGLSCMAGVVLLTTAPAAAQGTPDVVINEIRIAGGDEYFELRGAPGTSLTGLTYLVIGDDSGDGSGDFGKRSGNIETVVDLTGFVIPADGHFLVVENDPFDFGTDFDVLLDPCPFPEVPQCLNFENSDNVSHLLVSGFTGALGDDLDADNDCALDSTPWSAMLDAISLVETENDSESNTNECNYDFGGGIGPDGIFVPAQVYRCEPSGEWKIGNFGGADDTAGGLNVLCGKDVLINEVDADTPGSDAAEFVELYDGGVGNTDLGGLVLVFFNGAVDTSYRSYDLDGTSTNAQGYFVLCGNDANVPNCDLDVSPSTNLLQNGAEAVALYTGDAADFPNGTPVTTANLLDAIVYDVNDPDDAGLLVLLNANQPQVDECGGAGCSTDSNQRCPDGAGGARTTTEYVQRAPTPGATNNACQEICGAPEAGDCFDPEGNGSPGCNEADCCESVCEVEPACCEKGWAEECASIALVACRECGDSDTGDCFADNGTPYCSDESCCDLVCGMNSSCCSGPWNQACADMALVNCPFNSPQCGDVVFGLDNEDGGLSLELVRGPAAENGGAQIDDFWDGPDAQSVEFDNLGGISHNPQGNLLSVEFGPNNGSGLISSFSTCSPPGTGALIGDTEGLGGVNIDLTNLGGLSVSPNNDKIAVHGYSNGRVIVYDYMASDCSGGLASLSGARQTDVILCLEDTQGTAWLNNDTVVVFGTGGEIYTVNANTMEEDLIITLVTGVCGPGADEGQPCSGSSAECDGSCIGGCGPGFTDIEYAPAISPNVYAAYSAFDGGTVNTLFVLDPNLALLGTFNYSGSMETSREIAFDADGNLFFSQFGNFGNPPLTAKIEIIPNGADLGSLADNNSLDWYTSGTQATFSGLDVAHGCQACCLTDGCQDLDPADCAAQGGSAGGAGSACEAFCCTGADCDDGDPCSDDSCDEESGECSSTPVVCDDEDACTDDECVDGSCVFTPVICGDEDACTDDECVNGECVFTPVVCDDEDPCTDDECIDGECVFTPVECGGCAVCIDGECVDIEQTLIIKQGASGQGPDCEAPINSNSNGVIPILLVGTNTGFDVHDVNQGSLDLHLCGDGPSGIQPIANHTKFKDLNHPTNLPVGCPGCQCNDNESSDGIDDLSMKFSTDEVVATLGLAHGIYTLELTGTLNGVPFCARDCVIVVPPGSGTINATMESNVVDTLLEVTPMDLNFDIDGFADFSRAYIEGTTVTLTAPSTSKGRRFLRWNVDGTMHAFGVRTIDVLISTDTTLKAFYQRTSRVVPELPTEGDGDME